MNGYESTFKRKIKSEQYSLVGEFVFFEKEKRLMFRDTYSNLHNANSVQFLTNEWNIEEGFKNLPKPFFIAKDGSIKTHGDKVLYTFIHGNENDIVILGSLSNVRYKHYDSRLTFNSSDYEDLEKKSLVRNNKKRYFLMSDDADGNIYLFLEGKDKNGNLGIKVVGDDNQKNGKIKLELNGKFEIRQVNDNDEVFAELVFDNKTDDEKIRIKDKYNNKIELNKKGIILETDTIRIGKNQTIKKIFDALIKAILNMTQGTAAGGPTLPTKYNQTEFDKISSDLKKFMDVQ